MRPLLWPTLQTAVAAGIAWEISVRLFDHARPIFAPIVAIVAMGFTAGRRGRAAVLLVLGVAIGIGVGDVLVRVLDRGGIQVAVVVFVAMMATLFLTRESLVVVKWVSRPPCSWVSTASRAGSPRTVSKTRSSAPASRS
jgi:uncharacterized membrane protein YgaE (UPF0421/DUF939 family)